MAATGTCEVIASIQRLRLKQVEVTCSHPSVRKIVIETHDDEWINLVFRLTDVFNEADAEAIIMDIANSIIDRLALKLDLSIGEPRLKGCHLPSDESGSSHTYSTSLLVSWTVAPTLVEPGDEEREELVTLLETTHKRPDLHSAYRFAGNQRDAVARFMFLYNIMLQLHNDNQKEVDDFICKQAPAVPQSRSPHPPHRTETLYTRLRNEVSHARTRATPKKTRTEVENNVAAFQTLVKTAIL